MTRKTQKKLRKLLTLVCCAVMLVCVTVGATVAYLTSQDSVTNTFTVGNVQIKLNETDTDNDNVTTDNETYTNDDGSTYTRDKANAYKLIPGSEYVKDPMVTVLANSEDCYVRAIVTLNKGEAIYALPSAYEISKCFDIGSKWVMKSETYNNDGELVYEFWYEDEVLASTGDNELQKLFTKVTMPQGITNTELATLDGLTINVEAHAIQSEGFADAAAAWAAFTPAA